MNQPQMDSQYEAFVQLLRRLLEVPKSEVEQLEAARKESKHA